MENKMLLLPSNKESLDSFTLELFKKLFSGHTATPSKVQKQKIQDLVDRVEQQPLTAPIIELFSNLKQLKSHEGLTPESFGLSREKLAGFAVKHQTQDEHSVSVGGRLTRAFPIVSEANDRVDHYLKESRKVAPSGVELWEAVLETKERIKKQLSMSEDDWNSYSGQIKNCIDSVEDLAKIVDLPEKTIHDVTRVTQTYRMRLTPYYASLIQSGTPNDPVLLQSVPTGEMVDNVGEEIPPVAADHSPARLIDQFYPRVVTIKATNMCAMYCTHCLRIAHIGQKDRVYSDQAYEEALNYIRQNTRIRDVLVTGGDSFVLPNRIIKKLLSALDEIDHVKIKRLGTRIPATAPQRVDNELLDILAKSNDKKPIRVVTQINTAQEITPVSGNVFKQISKQVFAVLNQAVLLKGINDTRIKMWKLCETIQENYVRPYYIFNCSYRNPQFAHFRVPVEIGRDIVESMYGNISGDSIPRYIATAGGKIPLHKSNVIKTDKEKLILEKPWSKEQVSYPDADKFVYENENFSFLK